MHCCVKICKKFLPKSDKSESLTSVNWLITLWHIPYIENNFLNLSLISIASLCNDVPVKPLSHTVTVAESHACLFAHPTCFNNLAIYNLNAIV